MLSAALWSRSRSQPQCGQECHRTRKSFFTIHPHDEQTWEVLWGATLTTVEPASSALLLQRATNALHPASRMLLFKPPFAAAPFGTYFPFSSCLGLGRLVMLETFKSSNTRTAFSVTSL